MSTMLSGFEKHPDVAKAAHVGDPTLVDPEPVTALGVVRQMTTAAQGGGASEKLGVETIRGTDVPNQPAPRSDAPVATGDAAAGTPAAQAVSQIGAQGAPATAELKATVADPNELKPNVEPTRRRCRRCSRPMNWKVAGRRVPALPARLRKPRKWRRFRRARRRRKRD